MLKYSIENFDKTMGTNVRGSFLCTKEALRGMLRERWGRVVNVSSAVGLRGNPGQTAYGTSKTAMLGLTKSLAREIGARASRSTRSVPDSSTPEMTEYLGDKAAPSTWSRHRSAAPRRSTRSPRSCAS